MLKFKELPGLHQLRGPVSAEGVVESMAVEPTAFDGKNDFKRPVSPRANGITRCGLAKPICMSTLH